MFYPNDPERENLITLLESKDPVNQELGMAICSSNSLDLSQYWYDKAVHYAIACHTMHYFELQKDTNHVVPKKEYLPNYLSGSVEYGFRLYTSQKHSLALFLPGKRVYFDIFPPESFPDACFVRPENPFLSAVEKIQLDWSNSDKEPDMAWLRAFTNLRELKIVNYTKKQLPQSLDFIYAKIEVLDLNNLKLETLPPALAQAKKLKTLHLSDNPLGTLPDFLSEIKTIKKIFIANIQLKEMPSCLLKFKQLETLDIKNNKITEIPTDFYKLKALRCIEFYGNPIADWDMVFKYLKLLPNLKLMSWFGSKIIKTGHFFNYHKIKIENARDRSAQDWAVFFSNIRYFSGLRQLQISSCNLQEFPAHIVSNLRNLEVLDLNGNRLKNLDITPLKQLKKINLAMNAFSEIPAFIEHCTLLEELNIGNNNLGQIPEWIGKLQNLNSLYLQKTQISELPKEIFNALKKLQYLVVPFNNLTEIPVEIAQLSELKQLDVSGNKISEIPDVVEKLVKMTCLQAEANQLKNIPENIATLPALHTIKLAGNTKMDWNQAMQVMAKTPKIALFSWLQSHTMSNWHFNYQRLYLHGAALEGNIHRALEALTAFGQTEKIECYYARLDKPCTEFMLYPNLKELKFTFTRNIENAFQIPVLPLLEKIEIHSSNMHEIPEYFSLLPKLNSIKLYHHHIKRLPNFLLNIKHPLILEIDGIKPETIAAAFKQHPYLTLILR